MILCPNRLPESERVCPGICNIYLVRNEKDLKLWSFKTGNAFEPDYVLFLRKKGNDDIYDNIQIFIEPKGEHLRMTDSWKEECLQEIKDKADIRFSTRSEKFNVWGLPFYTESRRMIFDKKFKEELKI